MFFESPRKLQQAQRRTDIAYDGLDRLDNVAYSTVNVGSFSINPSDTEQYVYDNNGNITQIKKRSGALINQTYDNLNRLLTGTYPTDTAANVSYAYDLLNRRTQTKSANNTHTIDYVYDNASRLTITTAGGQAIAYQYDPANNRTRITWPASGRLGFYPSSRI